MMPIRKMEDKNSPDIWSEKEVKKFDVAGKLAKKAAK